jgi:nitroreductase
LALGKLLRKRRNVYGFLRKPIPDTVLRSIFENATHVPSAGFTQDFDLVVIKDEKVKRALADAAHEDEYVKEGYALPEFISKAPVVIVPCGSKPRFEMKYGTPAEKNSRLPWWLIDTGFASLALILSAFEKGLATSFVGAIDDDKVERALGLPHDHSIVPLAVVPVGYANPKESAKEVGRRAETKRRRRRLDEVVHWDRW